MRWQIRRLGLFLPVVLGLSALALFSRGVPWLGERQWALDMAVGTTSLSGPAVALAACWGGIGDQHLSEVVGSARRRGLLPVQTVAAAFLLGLVGLAASLGLVAVLTLSVENGGRIHPLPILSAAGLLLFSAALGYRVGSSLPRLVSLAIAPLLVFALGVLAAITPLPDWFRIGLHTGSLAGLAPSASVIGIGLFGLVAAAWALVPSVGTAPRAWSRWARGILVACTLGAMFATPGAGDGPYRPVRVAADECDGRTGIEICVVPDHRGALAPLVRELEPMVAALRSAGAALPPSIVEVVAGQFPPPGVSTLHLDTIRHPGPADAVLALLNPGGCEAFHADQAPAEHVWSAQADLAAWLSVAAGKSAGFMDAEPHRALLSMRPGERAAWIKATYADLTACRLNRLYPAGSPR